MTMPKKLFLNMAALLVLLVFLLSVMVTAVGYILFVNPEEFAQSPQMAIIFTLGLLVLFVILVSYGLILRHHQSAIRLFTGSAGAGIILSWLAVTVFAVIYQTGDTFGLFFFLTILFLPLYVQIYLINFRPDVITWIRPQSVM